MNEVRLELTDLPDEYREMAEQMGMGNFMRMVRAFGGTYVYIPKYDTVAMPVRDRQICREYNGYNINKLAIKYNLSVSRINDIITDIKKEIRQKPPEGQVSIFD